jgi:hypothetical protein
MDLRERKWWDSGDDCIMRSFPKYQGNEIKDDDMGGASNTYGREEKCVQNFGRETWGEETPWKTYA